MISFPAESSMAKEPRFIADCHFGKLAKYLRFMGYDTLYFPHIEDNDLIVLANEQLRTILTHDRRLSQRKHAPVFYLGSIDLSGQLKILGQRFGVINKDDESRRCLICNELLQHIDKETLVDKVPDGVKKHFDFFQQCPACGRIYWHGDHYHTMMRYLDSIL